MLVNYIERSLGVWNQYNITQMQLAIWKKKKDDFSVFIQMFNFVYCSEMISSECQMLSHK